MVGLLLRFVKLLILVVPVLVAIVECNDKEEPKPKPSTIHAVVPTVTFPNSQGELIIDLVDGSTKADLLELDYIMSQNSCCAGAAEWVHPDAEDEALAVVWTTNMAETASMIADHPLVEVVEPKIVFETPSSFFKAEGYPNDPMYPLQWHLKAMGAPYGWENTPRGLDVIVAVADTGVTIGEDLKGTKVLAGKSFVDNSPGTDRHGHGTHVAGTIAQSTNNEIGVAGVAPAATILPVKVLTDSGYGTSDGIAAGIDWAADQGAQVINLSLGGSYSAVIHNAIKKVTSQGVIVVAACGNDGRPQCGYPGGLEETIGVSATGPDGKLSFYSSHGKGVDIAAPGGDMGRDGKNKEGGVLQQTLDGYQWYQGTSMATPHVAGAVAVLLSTGLDTTQAKEILLTTADDSDKNRKYFGNGHLDLEAAVKAVDVPSNNTHNHIGLFIVSGLLALALGIFAETSRMFTTKVAATAMVVGGGLWFLSDVPFVTGTLAMLLATPVLEWPNILLWQGAAGFPLWASIAMPAIITFVFGAHRWTRPVATGLTIGFGASLLWSAAAGTLTLWGLPAVVSAFWLVLNGLGCLTLALATYGSQHLEEVHGV